MESLDLPDVLSVPVGPRGILSLAGIVLIIAGVWQAVGVVLRCRAVVLAS